MTKKRTAPDGHPRQLALPICQGRTKSMRAGTLCCKDAVREAFVGALKRSGLERDCLAAEMSRLTGESITANHINNWCSESKQDRRIPLEYAAAFCLIVEDFGLFEAALNGTGQGLADEKTRVAAEYGRHMAEKKKRAAKERELLEALL